MKRRERDSWRRNCNGSAKKKGRSGSGRVTNACDTQADTNFSFDHFLPDFYYHATFYWLKTRNRLWKDCLASFSAIRENSSRINYRDYVGIPCTLTHGKRRWVQNCTFPDGICNLNCSVTSCEREGKMTCPSSADKIEHRRTAHCTEAEKGQSKNICKSEKIFRIDIF